MHVSIRAYPAAGGLVNAVVTNEVAVRELLSGIKGFQSYCMARTPGGGCCSISIYDDAEGTAASNAAAAEWVAENVGVMPPPQVTEGDVALTF